MGNDATKEKDDALTPPDGYTEDEWEGLSDAEREGILDSINNPENPDGNGDLELENEDLLKKIAEEGDEKKNQNKGPQGNQGGDEGDKGKEEDKNVAQDGDGKGPQGVPSGDDKGDAGVDKGVQAEASITEGSPVSDEDLLSFRPAVTSAEIKIEEVIPDDIKSERAELKKKYDDGDISREDYEDQRDDINRRIFAHNQELKEAAKETVVWQKEQRFFLQNRPEYLKAEGDNDEVKANKDLLYTTLSSKVSQISNNPKNSHLTGMQILVRADREIAKIKEALGFKIKTATPQTPSPAPKKDVKPPAIDSKPDVKTLGDAPPAGSNSAEEDTFATLDKLQGEAYEAALEKLDPRVREAYLSRI